MIIGIGTDIISINRIAKLIEQYDSRFLYKIFTPYEISKASEFTSSKQKSAYFAKRFAAKEAYAKATGRGIRDDVTFKQIEIYNDEYGRPSITLHNNAKTHLKSLIPPGYNYEIHLSLSDDYPVAIAYVIIEAKQNE